MEGLLGFFAFIQANWPTIATLLGGIVTAYLTARTTNRKTDADVRKLGLDADLATRRLKGEESDAIWRREEAVNQRYDVMLARMEAQLESQGKKIDQLTKDGHAAEERAATGRRELRGVIDTQSTKISWLTRRVEQLIRAFKDQTGTEPPAPLEPPPPD